MELGEADALRAYARMMNTLRVGELEPVLSDDFTYTSQHVFASLDSKMEFLDYIRPKLRAIAAARATLFAEMATVVAYGRQRPCVVLAQNERANLVGLVLGEMKQGKLARLHMVMVPSPHSALRSGEYPA